MLKDLKRRKLLESLSKKGILKSAPVEGTPLEEQGESPKFERAEDEQHEKPKKKK